MKQGIRRIALMVLATGALALSFVTLSSLISGCGGDNCNMATVLFGVPAAGPSITADTSISMSTDTIGSTDFFAWGYFFQVLGIYLITLAVVLLLVLEAMELYYLRKIVNFRLRA